MLILHHLAQSRSFRIVWLLEELKAAYDLPYQLITHARNKQYLAPKQLTAVHPMGKAPILIDDSLPAETRVFAESALIIEYVLKTYDTQRQFLPADDLATWKNYHFWLHFAEGSLMPPLVMRLILQTSVQKSPFLVRPVVRSVQRKINALIIQDNIQKSLQLLNDHLKDKHWLCDTRFTGADIMLYFAVAGAKAGGTDFAQWTHINNWLGRCEHRKAFEQAVLVGGQPFR